MITIHGVPLSVHTRKAIVTAILKKMRLQVRGGDPGHPGQSAAELE